MSVQHQSRAASAMTPERAAGIISGLEDEIGKVIVGQHVLIRRMHQEHR